ncbi:MAG TPA: acyl-CoA thioesterase [Nitrospiria bacterium]
MPEKQEKTVADSRTEAIQVVLPNDTNPLGNLLGGQLMHWIDLAAAVVANRHSKRPVVTASMERLDFHAPVKLGQIVILKAGITYAGETSMEVGVEVFAEDPLKNRRYHTSTAILTYVALDDSGKPVVVPRLIVSGEEERRRFEAGQKRHEQRKRTKTAGG